MGSRSSRNRSQSPSDEFLRFTSSVHFDSRLWRYDIAGSIAHAHALAGARVLTEKELEKMVAGLRAIAHDLSNGAVELDPALEDIHMNVEKLLTDRIGPLGARLHTGRSRNDQVALDMRLMTRGAIADLTAGVLGLQRVLFERANEQFGTLMPGFTHMQHAQPVLLSHHLLAYFWKLQRDIGRLQDCYRRTNISPLGSGALAGTSFDLDRRLVADMLCMAGVTENSLDAVSDRDFVAESAFALSLLMIHLSSLCEELVLWASPEFGFAKLPERLSSGSSMMPQKRNPDIPELVRAKSGRTVGGLIAILTLLKSLPLAYNRDLQEDKENLFDVFDTVGASLHALTAFLAEVKFDRVRMGKAAEIGLMTATDLADFLANQGVPFRTAHGMVKELAARADGDDAKFRALIQSELKERLHGADCAELDSLLDPSKAVERKTTEGGTSGKAVRKQLEKARRQLASNAKLVQEMKKTEARIERLLFG